MKYKLLFLFLFLLSNCFVNADVIYEKLDQVDKFNQKLVTLSITESIVEEDEQKLLDILNEININHYRLTEDSIFLNTKGGDINTAMKMGHLIRKYHVATKVKKGDICNSACILILNAGVCKMALGSVGLHRGNTFGTYNNHADLKSYDYWSKLDDEKYYKDMGIHPGVVAEIQNTPHWDISYLSAWQKLAGGLFVITPEESRYRQEIASRRIAAPKEFLIDHLSKQRDALILNQPFWKRWYYKFFGDENEMESNPLFQFPSCSNQMFQDLIEKYPNGTDRRIENEFQIYRTWQGYTDEKLKEPKIIYSTISPYDDEISSFWIIDYYLKGKPTVTYKEVTTMTQPTQWNDPEGVKVSNGGKTATRIRTVENNGMLIGAWVNSKSDPKGPVKVDIYIDDKHVKNFNYEIR